MKDFDTESILEEIHRKEYELDLLKAKLQQENVGKNQYSINDTNANL